MHGPSMVDAPLSTFVVLLTGFLCIVVNIPYYMCTSAGGRSRGRQIA